MDNLISFFPFIISYTCDQYLGLQIPRLMNIVKTNQLNGKKTSFFASTKNELCNLWILHMVYNFNSNAFNQH
jgi:hypothetical protein